MNSTVKEIVDDAKRKLGNEERRHPERFSTPNYARGRLISYINIAKEEDIKENAKGYRSWMDKEFWEYFGGRAYCFIGSLVMGSIVGLIVLGLPIIWLILPWLGIKDSNSLVAFAAIFVGFVVVDGAMFDKTIENFKDGMLYEKRHYDKKYDDALEEINGKQ